MNKKISLLVAVLLLLTMLLPGAALAEQIPVSRNSMLGFMSQRGYETTLLWYISDDHRAAFIAALMVDLVNVQPYGTMCMSVNNVYVAKSPKPDTVVAYFECTDNSLLIVEFDTVFRFLEMTVISDFTPAQLEELLTGNEEYWSVDRELIGEKYIAAWSLAQFIIQ